MVCHHFIRATGHLAHLVLLLLMCGQLVESGKDWRRYGVLLVRALVVDRDGVAGVLFEFDAGCRSRSGLYVELGVHC